MDKKSQNEQINMAMPLSKRRRARYNGLRENLKDRSRTILVVGFDGSNGVLFFESTVNAPMANEPEIRIKIPPAMIRGVHDKLKRRNGSKYSRKILITKHPNKKSGGGIGTAALSLKLSSIFHLSIPLTHSCSVGKVARLFPSVFMRLLEQTFSSFSQ
jgi:hypothetical protein